MYDALIDEAECFDPGGDNDEIDVFIAIEVPTYIEEGYYDSEGDILYLQSLLSDDTTHNFSSDVFFDHETQQIRNEPENESLITFSPKSDPLHHEFTGELITIPPGIVREHEDYINRMSLLCGNSSSRSPENSHTIIESLPSSTTLVKDSDSNKEEIDIFFGPNDSIPPGIESDFDLKEDIKDNLLNDDPIPKYERLTFIMEPDVSVINNVDELNGFDPGGGKINVDVDDSFTFGSHSDFSSTFPPYLESRILVTVGCQKPGHLAARLGCAGMKVTTWDDLAFKLIILGWNEKHIPMPPPFINPEEDEREEETLTDPEHGMNIAKIARKRSKPDKHGHGNG
ncbi:hypothetical protein Tco_0931723 [Tanacetum coccineum]